MYVSGRARKDALEDGYRTYVTDALRDIAKNTANFNGGSSPKERWAELLDKRMKNTKEDNRTGEEIVTDVTTRAGIEVIDG